MVAFEQGDLVPFETETLGDSTANDSAANDDNPRHKEKIEG